MTTSSIPDDVKGLILDKLGSIEQLEILLLLHSEPQTAFTAEDVVKRLRNDCESAKLRLADLAAKGLISESGGLFRYIPKDDQIRQTVDALARAYAERRVTVINMIFSKPLERIQVFADAFRIRKGKDDG